MRRIWSSPSPRGRGGLLASMVLLLGAGTADAAFITTLYNTGVDASGNVLPNGTIGDPHYTLTSVPGGTTTLRVVTSANGYPIGPWLGDDTTSRWIGPNSDGQLDGPSGFYNYHTTFDLTGFNLATVVITGRYATDDGGSIVLNGATVGPPSGGFTSWTNFTLSSGFVAGINTLDFSVFNGGGPTGLRVEIISAQGDLASAVPAPAGAILFGIGLVGLAAFRALRRKPDAPLAA